MARITKKDIYASYDIQFDGEKIYCDLLDMWVQPLLINGNEKIGRGVWHFSTLAGKGIVSDEIVNDVIGKHAKLAGMTADELRAACGGTCCCNCPGCYAQAGNYQYDSVIVSLARKSLLSRVALEWVERAINAQIAADRIEYVRIHASGDFVSADYVICSNVLNVIDSDAAVNDVIRAAADAAKIAAVFTVYEGNGTGTGKQTGPDAFQRNEKRSAYVDRIAAAGYNVTRKGEYIIVSGRG